MRESYVCHDSLIYTFWFGLKEASHDMTHSYVCHDSLIYTFWFGLKEASHDNCTFSVSSYSSSSSFSPSSSSSSAGRSFRRRSLVADFGKDVTGTSRNSPRRYSASICSWYVNICVWCTAHHYASNVWIYVYNVQRINILLICEYMCMAYSASICF